MGEQNQSGKRGPLSPLGWEKTQGPVHSLLALQGTPKGRQDLGGLLPLRVP